MRLGRRLLAFVLGLTLMLGAAIVPAAADPPTAPGACTSAPDWNGEWWKIEYDSVNDRFVNASAYPDQPWQMISWAYNIEWGDSAKTFRVDVYDTTGPPYERAISRLARIWDFPIFAYSHVTFTETDVTYAELRMQAGWDTERMVVCFKDYEGDD